MNSFYVYRVLIKVNMIIRNVLPLQIWIILGQQNTSILYIILIHTVSYGNDRTKVDVPLIYNCWSC